MKSRVKTIKLYNEGKIEFWELQMHTEFTLKIEFYAPSKEAIATFVQMMKNAGQELVTNASLVSEGTPSISLTVENGRIGTKKIKVLSDD